MIYKTTVTVTVLSSDPIPQYVDLRDIAAGMEDGALIGDWQMSAPEIVPAEDVADELHAIGNDGSFFGDDE